MAMSMYDRTVSGFPLSISTARQPTLTRIASESSVRSSSYYRVRSEGERVGGARVGAQFGLREGRDQTTEYKDQTRETKDQTTEIRDQTTEINDQTTKIIDQQTCDLLAKW